MKIKRSALRKIINEEIKRCLVEQASDPKRVETDQAKNKEKAAELERKAADVSRTKAAKAEDNADKYEEDAKEHTRKAASMTESDSEDLDEIIEKLAGGKYRLYSKKKNPKTGKRRNLGTFDSQEDAEKHERRVRRFSEWKK